MLKTKARVAICFIGVFSVMSGLLAGTFVARQASAETSAGATFTVNVQESLSVTITTPQDWAQGNINTFLRNSVGVEVVSNNAQGYTASMYSSAGTNLTNVAKSSATLSTLSAAAQRASFPANNWGYSLKEDPDDTDEIIYNETDAGNADSYYHPMTSSTTAPITILHQGAGAGGHDDTQTIYFGAKADASKASGTYAGTVVISVVTGEVTDAEDDPNDNPITPTNPASSGAEGVATYDTTNNRTVYTTNSSNSTAGTDSTTTTVSSGDTRSSYNTPAGVTTSSQASTNNALAVALATTAGVAAVSSGVFFILAKRSRDDDEEEDQA